MLQILLFFHVLAVCGLFSGAALEIACFARFRRAAGVAEAREALCHVTLVGPIMRASVLLLLAAGLWMVFAFGFGWQPWIVTALVLTITMAAIGGAVNGTRIDALHAGCAQGDGPLLPQVAAARTDRVLNFAVSLLPCVLVALLFLMTNKPDWPGCIAAAAIAAAAAFVSGLLLSQPRKQAPGTAIPQ